MPWRKITLLFLVVALLVIGVATYTDAGNDWPPSYCSEEDLSPEQVWRCW